MKKAKRILLKGQELKLTGECKAGRRVEDEDKVRVSREGLSKAEKEKMYADVLDAMNATALGYIKADGGIVLEGLAKGIHKLYCKMAEGEPVYVCDVVVT